MFCCIVLFDVFLVFQINTFHLMIRCVMSSLVGFELWLMFVVLFVRLLVSQFTGRKAVGLSADEWLFSVFVCLLVC